MYSNGCCSRMAGSITALFCNHSRPTCTDNGSKISGNYNSIITMFITSSILKVSKSKSQFTAKYNYKDFVLLSPQRIAINGAIVRRGFEPGLSRSRVRHSTAEPRCCID